MEIRKYVCDVCDIEVIDRTTTGWIASSCDASISVGMNRDPLPLFKDLCSKKCFKIWVDNLRIR